MVLTWATVAVDIRLSERPCDVLTEGGGGGASPVGAFSFCDIEVVCGVRGVRDMRREVKLIAVASAEKGLGSTKECQSVRAALFIARPRH